MNDLLTLLRQFHTDNLGETLEQKRFFEQALAGDTDLLGRRGDEVGPRVGEVLPTRWIE